MWKCKRLRQEDREFETQLLMSLNSWLVSLAPSGTPLLVFVRWKQGAIFIYLVSFLFCFVWGQVLVCSLG